MAKKQSKSNNTYCVMCGLNTIADTTIEKTTSIKYEGKLYEISVSDLIVLRCGECGEIYLDNRADRQISRALRLHLGLLQPEDIREKRIKYELTQAQLAEHLNTCSESLSRWENGHIIQSRANDKHLRLFFKYVAPKIKAVGTGENVVQSYNPTANIKDTWLPGSLAEHTDEALTSSTVAKTQYALAA